MAMVQKKGDERIPAEQVTAFVPWSLPRIDAEGNVLPSFEKEQQDRRAGSHESVEVLEVDAAPEPEPLTAEMLEEIRQEAAREGHQAGFQQGLAEGRQRGHDDAWSAAAPQIEALQKELAAICGELLEPLRAERKQVIDWLHQQVIALSRAVIRRELQTDSSIIAQLAEEAVDALPGGARHIRISVNPRDAETVNSRLQADGFSGQLIADERIAPGGCRVVSEHSELDYSVEARLQALIDHCSNLVDPVDHNHLAN